MPHSVAPRAASDIRDIWSYGSEHFGIQHADRYAEEMERAFHLLAGNPHIARLRLELDPPVRAWRYRAHLIVYDVDAEERVTILRVRHGREDWISDPVDG